MFWIIGGATIFGSLADVWPGPVTFGLRRELEHVSWEGCHFYDLIYPLFLFLIGTVLPFSLNRRQAQGESLARLYLHFLKRSVVLIVLGSIPAGLLTFTKWPYLGGVLAHIGLCYLPAAILVRHAGWRTRGVVVGSWLVGVLATLLGIVLAYDSYYWTSSRRALPVSFFVVVVVVVEFALASLVQRRRRSKAPPPARAAVHGDPIGWH